MWVMAIQQNLTNAYICSKCCSLYFRNRSAYWPLPSICDQLFVLRRLVKLGQGGKLDSMTIDNKVHWNGDTAPQIEYVWK